MSTPPPAPTPQQQRTLVARIAAGDESALDSLYAATSAKLHGLALRILRDPAQAEEVTIDVFAEVWKHALRYCPERGSVMAWLVVLVRSRSLDRLRAERAGVAEVGPEPLLALCDGGQGPEDLAQVSDVSNRLKEALLRLSEKQRDALKAAFYAGMSHAEIARSQGLPLGTVKRRIRDGLEGLREILKPTQEELA